jgi:hypothetical protein
LLLEFVDDRPGDWLIDAGVQHNFRLGRSLASKKKDGTTDEHG